MHLLSFCTRSMDIVKQKEQWPYFICFLEDKKNPKIAQRRES